VTLITALEGPGNAIRKCKKMTNMNKKKRALRANVYVD